MITSLEWDDLVYSKPNLDTDIKAISKIIGIDSEAYTTGEPFMFCTPDDDILPEQIPDIFFTPKYVNANFVIYNMKYDSGALLYFLPRSTMYALWEENEVIYQNYKYQYIPHKLLRIVKGRDRVNFWDISQFYKSSLDKASQTYLNERKIDIRTKKFSKKFVHYFRGYIRKYCKRDAWLTEKLGEYLVNKLKSFNIITPSLYSCASISFQYFRTNTDIVTIWRLFKHHPNFVKMACDSYEGGKFEVTHRGAFTGYEYDITSAYPYEIANLVDISKAKVKFSSTYEKEAVYGFIRCRIDNRSRTHIPCGIMTKNVRVYPAGVFYLTVTKQEYEYMIESGVKVKIVYGAWLFVNRKRYPYRHIIDTLFEIKKKSKNDRLVYNFSKIIMNSFYGKTVQVIKMPDGRQVAGMGWNPVYGSVITANTRIKVTKIQNLLGNRCFAVHTDSVMTDIPLPDYLVKGGLGEFEYVDKGKSILIACGMYQLNKANAFKGFKPRNGDTWQSILENNRKKKIIPYPVLHVESWVEAMAKNHDKLRINVFADEIKQIDLNCDSKRIWKRPVTGGDLLDTFEDSMHKVMVQPNPPKHWK